MLCYRMYWCKCREMYYGRHQADTYVDNITTTYKLSTCPGSSGCTVYSVIAEEGERRLAHYVPHSRGSGKSGAGNTFVI